MKVVYEDIEGVYYTLEEDGDNYTMEITDEETGGIKLPIPKEFLNLITLASKGE